MANYTSRANSGRSLKGRDSHFDASPTHRSMESDVPRARPCIMWLEVGTKDKSRLESMPPPQNSSASVIAKGEGPTVAVVIPTYNRDELLEACLEHLRRQTFQSFRVIVVDNVIEGRQACDAGTNSDDNVDWVPLLKN